MTAWGSSPFHRILQVHLTSCKVSHIGTCQSLLYPKEAQTSPSEGRKVIGDINSYLSPLLSDTKFHLSLSLFNCRQKRLSFGSSGWCGDIWDAVEISRCAKVRWTMIRIIKIITSFISLNILVKQYKVNFSIFLLNGIYITFSCSLSSSSRYIESERCR